MDFLGTSFFVFSVYFLFCSFHQKIRLSFNQNTCGLLYLHTGKMNMLKYILLIWVDGCNCHFKVDSSDKHIQSSVGFAWRLASVTQHSPKRSSKHWLLISRLYCCQLTSLFQIKPLPHFFSHDIFSLHLCFFTWLISFFHQCLSSSHVQDDANLHMYAQPHPISLLNSLLYILQWGSIPSSYIKKGVIKKNSIRTFGTLGEMKFNLYCTSRKLNP